MILPYRRPYRLRVSRVVIEAMNLGMPVITTRGTTLLDQAEEFGAALACEEDSVDNVVKAILIAIQEFDSLRDTAKAKAEISRGHFSVAAFRQTLMAKDH
jgi:glycosyltransferase involved in cell wall biosynthesis